MILTLLFVVLTLVVTVFGYRNKEHRIAYSNTAVTLGVLGTFVGLLVGLAGFDVNDISNSIPVLLEGLKTAFYTSVVGMICCLLLRVIDWWPNKKDQEVRAETTLEYLQALDMKSVIESAKGALVAIHRGICGEDTDSSLLNQMKLMRQTLTDDMKELNTSFKQFTERQANDNTKAIMEALERVLSEFKVAIEENLSQSFREFSEACKNLYEWQSEHKDEIERVHFALNESIQVMKGNEALLSKLTEGQRSLVGTTGKLDAQLDELRAHTDALESLRKEWPYLLTEMQSNINSMLSQIGRNTSDTVSKVNECVSKTVDTARGMQMNLSQMVSQLSQDLHNVTMRIEQSHNNLDSKVQVIVSTSTKALEQAVAKSHETLVREFDNLMKNLFEPLNSILANLGNSYKEIKAIENRMGGVARSENGNRDPFGK